MSTESKKILWVDDEAKGSLSPLGTRLERAGIKLDIATTFNEAEQRLKETNYAAVLMDLIIPLDGGKMASDLGVQLINNIRNEYYHHGTEGTQSNVLIVILSVVHREEIRFEPQHMNYKYFDKIRLLEPGTLESLINILSES